MVHRMDETNMIDDSTAQHVDQATQEPVEQVINEHVDEATMHHVEHDAAASTQHVEPVTTEHIESDLPVNTLDVKAEVSLDVSAEVSAAVSGITSPVGDSSRAGRKRKANSKYLDEPSPVLKPAPNPRKSNPLKKSVVAQVSKMATPVVPAVAASIPAIVGPPTFGSQIFGKKGSRKYSDDFSELEDLDVVDQVDDLVDQLEVVDQTNAEQDANVDNEQDANNPPIFVPVKMSGEYLPSGVAGPVCVCEEKVPIAFVAPSSDWISFPNVVPDLAVVAPTVHVLSELGGGGILGLYPKTPVYWIRDEVPKLSAYFKKKIEGNTVLGGAAAAVPAKRVSLSAKAEFEEAKRRRELEQRRILEERQRRKERERLKQLYRQHWIALTKFPIEDSILHSRKGIRRLGGAAPIANPLIYEDCLLAGGVLGGCGSNLLVVWAFFAQFGKWLVKNVDVGEFTFPKLVCEVHLREKTSLISRIHWALIEVLRPWIVSQLNLLVGIEQVWESQLMRNRNRAKIFWPTFSQFRDFLHLGWSLWILDNGALSRLSGTESWLLLYLAKAIVLFESIDTRREFLSSVSAAFEEIDFEYKFITLWQNECTQYTDIPVAIRISAMKVILDKILCSNLMKKIIDVFCEAKLHLTSEISVLEKEERKSTQKISLCERIISILGTESGVAAPLSPAELEAEIAARTQIQNAKKISQNFADKSLSVRFETLGKDRFFNEYFQVSFNRKIVFVKYSKDDKYGIYDSLANLEALIQSLDERGQREFALKNELQTIKANLFADLMAVDNSPKIVYRQDSDWLSDSSVNGTVSGNPLAAPIDVEPEIGSSVKPLYECMAVTRQSLTMIKACWYGEKFVRVKRDLVKKQVGRPPKQTEEIVEQEIDDDDMTVDEGMEMEDTSPNEPEPEEEEEETVSVADEVPQVEFKTEIETLVENISNLDKVLTNCIREGFFASGGNDVVKSVLTEFHIKSGTDFLRHCGITQEKLQPLALIVGGLLAVEEVVLAEISRHGQHVGLDLSIWSSTGGDKAAWKLFLGNRPAIEDDEPSVDPISSLSSFTCEICQKKFGLHILFSLHKLVPCKTRGRKPLPTEPQLDIEACGGKSKGGPLAIDSLVLPQFPPPPSTRVTTTTNAASTGNTDEQTTTFPCDICGKVFPQNQGLAVHQTRWCIPEQQAQLILNAQQAAGGEPGAAAITCETCGKVYPTAQGLAIHQSRWCKKIEDAADTFLETCKLEENKVLYRETPIEQTLLAKVEDIETNNNNDNDNEPGYTPACNSVPAMAIATQWLANRIEKALDNFTKVHHSKATSSKKK